MTDAVYMIVPFVVVVVGFGVLAFVVLFDRKAKQQAERAITTKLLDQLYSLETSDTGRNQHVPSKSKHDLKDSGVLSPLPVVSSEAIDELVKISSLTITPNMYRSAVDEIKNAQAELAKEAFHPMFATYSQTGCEKSFPLVHRPLIKRERKSRSRNVEPRKHSV
ncbi:hypothetical protein [Vibrio parahaemolyticus]|uniref:hypothetical protein n=1 Tax=Vibrio parahaemolyticus TaxID=670 RepID=UPI0011214633|nr:hypothetical protein [Vibrio parahaemolyticus]MCX4134796.1 hypothetical protein [Vibrio parahaemolyticus]MCZ6386943.1 hypothetical protein [Vibrio parahaemolyticus]MDF4866590.1 hypothetical protein [Vibrio parahaemolyticus]MRE01285.1 hypothetical protein [Vibrio parahaemolyticus]QNE57587.1 hypothetical protein H5404_17280 [Vibrio parahaemolyticus]